MLHTHSRKEAESLREGLAQHLPCAFYHGDLTAESRRKAPRSDPDRMHMECRSFRKAACLERSYNIASLFTSYHVQYIHHIMFSVCPP